MPADYRIVGKNFPEPIDPLTRVCFIIEIPDALEYRAAIMGQVEWLADWRCWRHDNQDFDNPPQNCLDVAQLFAIAVSESRFEDCPMDCAEMLECLAPLFNDLTTQITTLQAQIEALQTTTETIQQAQNDNATAEKTLEQSEVGDAICGAATGIVEAMHQTTVDTYEDTEAGVVDSALELIPKFIRSVPLFGELPFDELFELVNWYFENQFEDYNADFNAIKTGLICDLKCFVEANDNVFDWDVWKLWLDSLNDKYPGNRAAGMFAKYSPTRQTWINQIAALINKEQSLQAYFDMLGTAWVGGLNNPVECVDCVCAGEWEVDIDFTGASMPPNWTVTSGTHVPGLGILPAAPVGELSVTRVAYNPLDEETILEFIIHTTAYPVDSFGQVFSPFPSGSNYTYNFQEGAPGTDFDCTGLPAIFSADEFQTGVAFFELATTEYMTGLHIEGDGLIPYTP